jgi:cyclohexyl-isocyanide hydratase
MQVGMLLFPKLTQLDLTGPYEVLSRIPGATMHTLWKSREPVTSDTGLTFVPSTTYADAPPLDMIFVPGGAGQIDAMDDGVTVDFVRAAGQRATWVTSTCTGSLVLGAAGLLRGYRAATHWAFMDLLPLFGAEPVHERVVVDRNRITAGGVTAGIDFGLRVAAEVGGRELAETIQLYIEYDPAPPFTAGHPRVAPPEIVAKVRERLHARFAERKRQIERLTRSV